jgi:hypothetical protein
VRRIALLCVVVGALAAAATAWAVTNTVSYSVTIKKGPGTPSAKKPVNIGYNAILHIDTDPAGSQPDTAPVTSIYFAKQIKQNSKLLPSCSQADIDGKASFPAKCKAATVGTGTASALAGSPGSPAANSVQENLNVTFVNGPAGKQVLLVLNSSAGAPVAITNRVVPGDLGAGKGPYGYRVDFKIPPDLQNQLGLSIALTDFKVQITNKAFPVKIHGKKAKVSYLQLAGKCTGGQLPVEAIAHFVDANGNPTDVTNDSNTKC